MITPDVVRVTGRIRGLRQQRRPLAGRVERDYAPGRGRPADRAAEAISSLQVSERLRFEAAAGKRLSGQRASKPPEPFIPHARSVASAKLAPPRTAERHFCVSCQPRTLAVRVLTSAEWHA